VSADGFFQHRREWSQWKHRLLRKYLGKFAGILGSRHATVYYVDGFAGAGSYTNPSEDGSPVIAARMAAEDPANQRPYELRCINVEPDSFDELVAATESIAPGRVENRRGTFRQNLPGIFDTIGKSPALFFLDPYGSKGAEWDLVSQIADRTRSGPPTEVLLNFFVSKIDRAGGWLDSTGKAHAAFVKNLDDFFGTAEWQRLYAENLNHQRARTDALSELYLKRLSQAFGIAARYEVKTKNGRTKYHLIHGTHSPVGSRAMSEAVFGVLDEYRQVTDDAAEQLMLLPIGPTDAERTDNLVKELARDIYALKEKRTKYSFIGLQDALIPDFFGRAVERHYKAACKLLSKEGKIKMNGLGSRGGIKPDSIIEVG
jgi:three-Cys-motif partner protein